MIYFQNIGKKESPRSNARVTSPNSMLANGEFDIRDEGNGIEVWVTQMGEYMNMNTGWINRASGTVAIVDPFDSTRWVEALEKEGLRPTHLLYTHTHRDHTAGYDEMKKLVPEVKVWAHEEAVSGDYLTGEVESDIFTSVGETLNPLKTKVERVIIGADSLLIALNDVLDLKSRDSFKRTILGLETTVSSMTNTLSSFNKMIDSTKGDIDIALENTKKITANFVKVSDTLATVNFGQTVRTLQTTLANVNGLLSGIENGKGSLGKLATDDSMYNNLTNASKELEDLLKEMKLHPKRFVHFSLFGKKTKPFVEDTSKKSTSN